MPLGEGQWQVRGLTLGPFTPYTLMDESNPFTVTVRADQGGPRAWNHGSWSGAEWANERVIPMRLHIQAASQDVAGWVTAHQQLTAAFAAVGDAGEQVDLRFVLGGREYVVFGRPRMVEPDVALIGAGQSHTRCAFVAQDPRIYAGVESTAGPIGLPSQAGGLLVPYTVPYTVGGTLVGGEVGLLNEGTTAAPLFARIDGPVPDPRITLRLPNGALQQVRFNLVLPAGQWIDVDSAAGTAFLNGLPTSSVFGQTVWDLDPYPLAGDPSGVGATTTVRFGAADVDTGTLTLTHRSSWW